MTGRTGGATGRNGSPAGRTDTPAGRITIPTPSSISIAVSITSAIGSISGIRSVTDPRADSASSIPVSLPSAAVGRRRWIEARTSTASGPDALTRSTSSCGVGPVSVAVGALSRRCSTVASMSVRIERAPTLWRIEPIPLSSRSASNCELPQL